MAKTSISIQVDEDLLKSFDEFSKAIGSNRSGVINILMQQCVNSQELPKISIKKPSNAYSFEAEHTFIADK